MDLDEFDFYLPNDLIAQTPLKDRTSSKLMVINKHTGIIKNEPSFNCILSYLKKGDCLVLNDTKVIPARLFGTRKHTGATVEILLLERKDDNRWEILVKPGKKAKIGDTICFGNGILDGTIEEINNGNRIINFKFDGIFEEILDKLGHMPLPPYITEKLEDKDRYQTVYAKNNGSSAAPTAGLHFTNDLLEQIKEKGVSVAKLTLHVGLGTFRPVKTQDILEHKMHSEYYNLDSQNAIIINNAKQNRGKIISVGSTCTRTLESIADINGIVNASSGYTDIFIYPSYKFKIIDGLITNFHLPKSSLIMLTSAFATRNIILNAYQEAILNKYRFFSFGDAMFLTD